MEDILGSYSAKVPCAYNQLDLSYEKGRMAVNLRLNLFVILGVTLVDTQVQVQDDKWSF